MNYNYYMNVHDHVKWCDMILTKIIGPIGPSNFGQNYVTSLWSGTTTTNFATLQEMLLVLVFWCESPGAPAWQAALASANTRTQVQVFASDSSFVAANLGVVDPAAPVSVPATWN